ncbi:MAG: hypothetical protein H6658_09790 [Ardenticatenaceae bacterium]|nr:hypothetical protein [Ardenticatenaceae bacterium]
MSSFQSVNWQASKGRALVVGAILTAALIGFEIFNFDTTRFALMDLMGGHLFFGIEWASILAFAFCSIDFAGVVRMFTPEQSLKDEPKEVLLLMGAWLLGASLNAVMTWYAVALTIAPRTVGATLIAKDDMLFYAPLFVAVLVWLTRILLIGSSSVAADRLMSSYRRHSSTAQPRTKRSPVRSRVFANGDDNFQDDFFSD